MGSSEFGGLGEGDRDAALCSFCAVAQVTYLAEFLGHFGPNLPPS